MKKLKIILGEYLYLQVPSSQAFRYVAGLLTFLVCFCLPNKIDAQQFVKTYSARALCANSTGNLTFHCITKTLKSTPTFYIAGIQDTSLYIAEIDANGVVLQEKLIGIRSKTYNLRSMITDGDGNIVIVGSATLSYPFKAFIMKISSALSILYNRTFNNLITTGSSQLIFMDVKDNKFNGQYCVAGGIRNADNVDGSDALLINIDRNTGTITNYSRGNAGEDQYDALILASPYTWATGRLSHPTTPSFRPWLSSYTGGNFSYIGSARFLVPETVIARLYSSSLISDNSNLLFAWHGQLAGSNLGINTGITNANTTTGGLNWQKQYTFTPIAEKRIFLTKVASDTKGFVAEGNWWNGSSYGSDGGYIGEMFFLRTAKNGSPIWSRKIKNVWVNSYTHNASFVIAGSYIYAVGYQNSVTSAFSQGVLVKIPLMDGAMDTTCSVVQTATEKEISYYANETIAAKTMEYKDISINYPVNCVITDTILNCNNPCEDSKKPNADFDITGTLQSGNATNYLVTANNFSTSPNSQWIVSETNLTSPYADISGTVCGPSNPSVWGTNQPSNFGGYIGTSVCIENTGTSLSFKTYHRYRFKHILSFVTDCGIVKSDTVSKTIYMCPGCRVTNGKRAIVENDGVFANEEKSNKQNRIIDKKTTAIRLMPNPVSGGTLTIENPVANKSMVQITITNMLGKKIVYKQFSNNSESIGMFTLDVSKLVNGVYTVTILNDGNSTNHKFVVAR